MALLHNEVLPFFAQQDLEVKALLANNGSKYSRTNAHPMTFA